MTRWTAVCFELTWEWRCRNQDEDSPYATWPPPSSLIQGANAFNNHNTMPVSGLGLELYPIGVGNEWSPDVEECGAEWGVESMQCDCYNCATVSWNIRAYQSRLLTWTSR